MFSYSIITKTSLTSTMHLQYLIHELLPTLSFPALRLPMPAYYYQIDSSLDSAQKTGLFGLLKVYHLQLLLKFHIVL